MRKNIIFLVAFSIGVSKIGFSQCGCPPIPTICEKNIVTDFGAKPNNAQFAFERASKFINDRGGYVRLTVPSGTYLVGKQTYTPSSTDWTFEGGRVMKLSNSQFVTIVGVGSTKPVLKYVDGLYFGMFDQNCLNPLQNAPGINSAHAGVLLKIENKSHNIEINNIDFDGNVDNFILGGNYGAGTNPIEREHYGIFLEDSYDVAIKNMDIKNFGTDGILILDNKYQNNYIVTNNIDLQNINISFSGRNALSWVGGHNIRATNCSFNKSGRGIIKTNPGAGIDIEPERGSTCSYGYFTNCVIDDNGGFGFSNGANPLNYSSNIYFKNSTLIGRTNRAGLTGITLNLNFDSCNIYGAFWCSGDANNLIDNNDKAIHFRNCYFSDCYNGTKMNFTSDQAYLFGIGSKRTLVDQCVFKSYYYPTYYIGPDFPCGETASRPVIMRSTFYSYLNTQTIWGNNLGLASHSTFSVNTFYSKSPLQFNYSIVDPNMCNYQDGPNYFNYFASSNELPICGSAGKLFSDSRYASTLDVEKNTGSPLEIFVYPNPIANSVIHVNAKSPINKISIIDALGKLIYYCGQVNDSKKNIEIRQFTSGMYYMTITTKEGSLTKKFIKI